MSIESTLAERGTRYGDFTDHARIAQEIQDAMRRAPGWERLSPVQKQALSVIADKQARILSGDPNYADNWHDIQGYARLAEERLEVHTDANGDVVWTGCVSSRSRPNPHANDNQKPSVRYCGMPGCVAAYGFGCGCNGNG